MATTTVSPTLSGQPAAYMRLAELLMGSRITMGLRVVVERGIADLLGDDARSAAELASQAGYPRAIASALDARAVLCRGVPGGE